MSAPCLDGICTPKLKQPYTIVGYPGEICLIFHISYSIRRVSELKNRYWLKADDFLRSTGKKSKKILKAYC